jgi:hypothetical protein
MIYINNYKEQLKAEPEYSGLAAELTLNCLI